MGLPPDTQTTTASPALERNVALPGSHLQHEPDIGFVETTTVIPPAVASLVDAKDEIFRWLRTRVEDGAMHISDCRTVPVGRETTDTAPDGNSRAEADSAADDARREVSQRPCGLCDVVGRGARRGLPARVPSHHSCLCPRPSA